MNNKNSLIKNILITLVCGLICIPLYEFIIEPSAKWIAIWFIELASTISESYENYLYRNISESVLNVGSIGRRTGFLLYAISFYTLIILCCIISVKYRILFVILCALITTIGMIGNEIGDYLVRIVEYHQKLEIAVRPLITENELHELRYELLFVDTKDEYIDHVKKLEKIVNDEGRSLREKFIFE